MGGGTKGEDNAHHNENENDHTEKDAENEKHDHAKNDNYGNDDSWNNNYGNDDDEDNVEMFQMMSPRYSATAISWPDRGMVGDTISLRCDTSYQSVSQLCFQLSIYRALRACSEPNIQPVIFNQNYTESSIIICQCYSFKICFSANSQLESQFVIIIIIIIVIMIVETTIAIIVITGVDDGG